MVYRGSCSKLLWAGVCYRLSSTDKHTHTHTHTHTFTHPTHTHTTYTHTHTHTNTHSHTPHIHTNTHHIHTQTHNQELPTPNHLSNTKTKIHQSHQLALLPNLLSMVWLMVFDLNRLHGPATIITAVHFSAMLVRCYQTAQCNI